MTTHIRPAQYADAQAVFTLAQPFATSFVVEEQAFHRSFSALLASSQAHLAVAETARQLVGYVLGFAHYTFFANGRVAWVEEITVSEAFRRQGIGQLLMQEFEAWAVARGCKLVALVQVPVNKGWKIEPGIAQQPETTPQYMPPHDWNSIPLQWGLVLSHATGSRLLPGAGIRGVRSVFPQAPGVGAPS